MPLNARVFVAVTHDKKNKGVWDVRRSGSTIKEVALKAGVSPMTVSRVLNNQDVVRETTKRRVFDAIRELNYRPSIMARSLANGRSLCVGLLYTNPSHGYLSELLLGTLSACRERQHLLVVEKPDEELLRKDPQYVEQTFLRSSIQALVVAPPLSEDADFMAKIAAAEIRYISLGPVHWGNGLSICIDEVAASCDMTNHLLELGHRDIGLIRGPAGHAASALRFEGYKRAIEKAGIPVNERLIADGNFDYHSGREAARKLLSGKKKPTAIFATNDDMACGAIGYAYEQGLRIPRDLSVVGFDDSPSAAANWPPLTTIRQPVREMAEIAVRLLDADFMTIAPDQRQRVVPHTLIKRESARTLLV